ncbi:MAG: hypothetical protein BroJett011_72500 [Chloroflexota bacterium]|nr:MAG: hypothetical protein BroJett011_72500 [Chloroflexota bacterium]
MLNIALSTMWGIGRYQNLADFFSAGANLGFTCFELNHKVTSAMLEYVNLPAYHFPSVHEPCPADIAVSELKARNWFISSPREDERTLGVTAVRHSIDLAQQLGAQAVVVHPGKVDMDESLEKVLRDLYRANQAGSPEFAEASERLAAARSDQVEINLRAVQRSLVELARYAGSRGIRLGLENRFHYYEIPLPDELEFLLAQKYEGEVGFWYDVGHAHVLEQLDHCPHEGWLRRFAGRMVGVHLHDVIGLNDHRAAGLGQVDWKMVAAYLPKNILCTCEFQNDNTPEQVAHGLRFLAEKVLGVDGNE